VVWLALRRWGPRRWSDVRLCLREGLVPRDLDEARENIGPGAEQSWVSPRAKRAICALLDPEGAGDDRALSDKCHFDRLARAAGLPLPETIGRGALDAPLPAWIESGSGLILKRGYSLQGKGIAALAREGAEWRADGGPVVDLIGWLRANLDPAGNVQRRLRTHAALADLSPTALPTLRVIVCLDERGEPEPTHAFLRLGPIGSALDNFSAGGISAAANLGTGILAEARIRHGRGGRVDRISRHPVTDAAIEGREVPLFQAAVALAAEAHRRLFGGRRVLIGWDIGLSEDGAMLIEGNWNPGSPLLQLVSGTGIAGHRLGDLMTFHLRRLQPSVFASMPVVMRMRGPPAPPAPALHLQ
jgi:hypothetical protein